MTVEVVRKDLCTPVVFISRKLLEASLFFHDKNSEIEKLRLIIRGNGVLDG